MDRIQEEVANSKARVEETRMERRRKRLEDIREDERRNDPARLDKEARNDLQREEANMTTGGGMGGERVDEGQVADGEVSNLRQMFENINANNQIIEADRVDHLLAAIADHSTIDPRTLGAGDEPRDWDDAQWQPPKEAAEWKTTFEDEAKGLKDMGIYVLIPRSEVPEGIKICHCKAVLKNKLDENGNLA